MTMGIIYSGNFTKDSREELIQKVSNQMSEKRFAHVLRVEEKACYLAERYGINPEKASIAALTHDYAKERPDEEMIDLILKEKFDQELLIFGNAIWHGILGSFLVEKELEIIDDEILEAIRLHTTGASQMSELAKLIYVADYIEEGRKFSGVQEAREIADVDLDKAVAFETRQTLLHLINKGFQVYPKTIETYNTWVANK